MTNPDVPAPWIVTTDPPDWLTKAAKDEDWPPDAICSQWGALATVGVKRVHLGAHPVHLWQLDFGDNIYEDVKAEDAPQPFKAAFRRATEKLNTRHLQIALERGKRSRC